MEYRNIFPGFLFCCILLTASYSYMIFEEKQDTDNTVVNNNKIKFPDLPPISIVVDLKGATRTLYILILQSKEIIVLTNNPTASYRDAAKLWNADLTKTSLKLSRKEAEKKKSMKKKAQQKKPPQARPSPAPNCVATWASCKSPSRPCCEFCAFCYCRLFQTVCYCRMGNPNC